MDYDELVVEIAACGGYEHLCCLISDPRTMNTLKQWVETYGWGRTDKLLRLVCSCSAAVAPPPDEIQIIVTKPVTPPPPPPPPTLACPMPGRGDVL